MKCNLDCSYCPSGIDGGHFNSSRHPPLSDCLDSIDFMFKYVDLYMSKKSRAFRHAILNVYGGESLHYPHIVAVLEQARSRHQDYSSRWSLTVTTTTNAIIAPAKLQRLLPLIDEFTCSYHSENTAKQKQQFKQNLLTIAAAGKRLKTVTLIHSDPVLFEDNQRMIAWLQEHNIRYLARQLDHHDLPHRKYEVSQVKWFQKMYRDKGETNDLRLIEKKSTQNKIDLSQAGRACCGGRSLCHSQSTKEKKFFVSNKFPDWYCSVNEFFLFIKQIDGRIFVNKDCQMNFEGSVGPIGNLRSAQVLLDFTADMLAGEYQPKIQCKKNSCLCGLCAPKAQNRQDFLDLMEKYRQ